MGICHGKPIEHRSKQSRSQVSAETDEANEVGSLDKSFGFSKQFSTHYEIDGEVGRGHLGYTCSAKGIKGTSKGHEVAVKVIHKAKVWFFISLDLVVDSLDSLLSGFHVVDFS